MKITKQYLKQIIKEAVNENVPPEQTPDEEGYFTFQVTIPVKAKPYKARLGKVMVELGQESNEIDNLIRQELSKLPQFKSN